MKAAERQARSRPPGRYQRRGQTALVGTAIAVDVTDEFDGLAPEDTVYRTDDGFLVKVKGVWYGGHHGAERIHYTGAIVDRTGKALKRDDGTYCIHQEGIGHTHKSDGVHDFGVACEISKLRCVQLTVNGERHYQALKSAARAPGLVTVEEQAARRAAEKDADAVPDHAE